MSEDVGGPWVTGTIRAVMVKRRMTYAGLVERLKALGVEENERALRNKVARGTFSAVFFVQCLEAMGLDTLRLDMHEVMARPEAEREFGGEVPAKPSAREAADTDRILAEMRRVLDAEKDG